MNFYGKRLLSQFRFLYNLSRWKHTIYWNDKSLSCEKLFNKVLVANRGEIACRVIKTCRRLGIKTVAVFSDADSRAVHVRSADEAVYIGGSQATQSYLNVDAILRAVKDTKSEAVHPGYGFLSENTVFAQKLHDAGVSFIGPNSKAIRLMGDKIESKRIAMNAKVNTIPGYDGVLNDADEAVEKAHEIGYPVMLKASAGGGGKGMRIAWNDDECREAFRFSSEEAKSSFGDDRMLIEKFIAKPRHIEMQVLCDKHGNSIHLNERECSIQRRNQKVVEEAPSSFLNAETRNAMGDQAVALSRAVGYDSAGTVEFLVDADRNFYFLEMNTRLQVEHPVTEYTTGVDLVHQMIRVAKGHELLHKQEDIGIKGWSMECRVYAEDPYRAFGLPSVGRLSQYSEPTHLENVRCDSGIVEGSDISIHYDPIISKLISYGSNRSEAIHTMVKALDSYVIRGVTHNVPLLRDIMTEPRFQSGDISTNYLTEVYPDGFQGTQLSPEQRTKLLCIASALYFKDTVRSFSSLDGQTLPSGCSLTVRLEGSEHNVEVSLTDSNKLVVQPEDGKTVELNNADFVLFNSRLSTSVYDEEITFQILSKRPYGKIKLQFLGSAFELGIVPKHVSPYLQHMPKEQYIDTANTILAPMPGLLKSIAVSVGQQVAQGAELCVLEAMKMQNSLVTTKPAKVVAIHFKEGDTVDEGEIIVELESS